MVVLVDDRSTGDLALSAQRHAEQANTPLVTALKHGLSPPFRSLEGAVPLDLAGCTMRTAGFEETTFTGDAWFDQVTFSGPAGFRRTPLSSPATAAPTPSRRGPASRVRGSRGRYRPK